MFYYIHIPFCRQKCQYCKFALTPRFTELQVRTYIDALKREIGKFIHPFSPEVVSDSPMGTGGRGSVESIYFGGGTPSILTSSQIGEILEVFQICTFPFSDEGVSKGRGSIEITLEANPEDITSEYLVELAQLGVNRLSLGVQTLNGESLRMVGRANSNESIFRALECLAQSPIENISIDLIAGLPGTVPGQIVQDLETIFARMSPKHVSIYMLEDEKYPESWKPFLPDEEAIRKEYISWMEWLENKWFHRYELSNFALPGYESRHNQAYWNHSEYLGFGLSASSFVGGERCTNSSSFAGYYRGEKITEGILSEESLRIERMMFGLRTSRGVLLDDLNNTEIIERLQQEGLIETRENRVFLTSTWIFLIDHIIGELV